MKIVMLAALSSVIHIVTTSGAEKVDLPALSSPQSYSDFFDAQAKLKSKREYKSIHSSHFRFSQTGQKNETFSRAKEFLSGLKDFQKFLAEMNNEKAVVQYAGMCHLEKEIGGVSGWGNFIVGRSLSIVILKDLRSRLLNDKMPPQEVKTLLTEYAPPAFNQSEVLQTIDSETDLLRKEMEVVRKGSKADLDGNFVIERALFRIDQEVSFLPLFTLDNGNLGGLFELAKEVPRFFLLAHKLADYRQVGGEFNIAAGEFKTKYDDLLGKSDKVSDSVDAEQVYMFMRLPWD